MSTFVTPWIDTHVHIWDQLLLPRPWLSARIDLPRASVVPTPADLARSQVGGLLLVEAGVPAGQADAELQWLLRAADQHDDILGVVGAAEWRVPDTLERLRDIPGLVGVRFNIRGVAASRANVIVLREAFAAAREARLVVDVLASPAELTLLTAAIDGSEHGQVVLDHLGNPPVSLAWSTPHVRHWVAALAHLGAARDVSVKISGLPALGGTRDDWMPFIETAIASFPAGSLVLGSDWPVSRAGASYGDWVVDLLARLGSSVDEGLLRTSAIRIYDLTSPH